MLILGGPHAYNRRNTCSYLPALITTTRPTTRSRRFTQAPTEPPERHHRQRLRQRHTIQKDVNSESPSNASTASICSSRDAALDTAGRYRAERATTGTDSGESTAPRPTRTPPNPLSRMTHHFTRPSPHSPLDRRIRPTPWWRRDRADRHLHCPSSNAPASNLTLSYTMTDRPPLSKPLSRKTTNHFRPHSHSPFGRRARPTPWWRRDRADRHLHCPSSNSPTSNLNPPRTM